jgi:site-specific DNA recombinase
MRVVLYARVSSTRQAEKELSIAAQLKALRNYAQDRGWEIYKEFVDEAKSGRSTNRPDFRRMIAFAKQRHTFFDAILVWKFSRFARNREDSIIYKSLLRKHGISVISINEQVDESPAGELLEAIIEAVDEFYSSNLAQDAMRGMKENAEQGYYNGGVIPIGYIGKKVKVGKHEKTRLEPDEVFAPLVRRIYQMCIDGMGAKEISKTLNAEGITTNKGKTWSKTKIYYILKNEIYTGTLVWNRSSKSQGVLTYNDPENIIRVENTHPPLIDRETFKKVQDLLKQRSPKVTHPRTINSRYLLSGFLYCGQCGSKMVGHAAKSSQFFYYACQNYTKRGKDICDAKLINKDKLESFIIDSLKAIFTEQNVQELVRLTNEEILRAKNESHEQLHIIDGQLEELRRRLDRLYSALETGALDVGDLAPRIKALKSEIDTLEEQRCDVVEHIQDASTEMIGASAVKTYVENLKTLLSKGSLVEQKTFLHSFIKRIELNLPYVAVDYTIPVPIQKVEPLVQEVLPFKQDGGADETRTRDLRRDRPAF